MCGIVGVYHSSTQVDIAPLLQSIQHRGPDGADVIQTAVGALGHTRLALLDRMGGQQALHQRRPRIGFDGALYNREQLRQRHLAEQPLRTCTDTEVLLQLYNRFGASCAALLDGMFAVAILSDQELFLARDPLGIKPLYYGEKGDRLYFASEIKALTSVVNQIREFPAGHWYHSQLGWHKYYRATPAPSSADEILQREEEALPLLRATLRAAVHKQVKVDGALGVNLSGGLGDSIVALLAQEHHHPCYSFAVGMEDSSHLAAARIVAQRLDTNHHQFVYSVRDLEAVLPTIIYHLESFDPTMVRSAIADYFLAQLAAQHVKVLLTGEGAAELYAGYGYLHTFTEPSALQAELMTLTATLHNTLLQRVDRMAMAHSLQVRLPFLDLQSMAFALHLPPAWKIHRPGQPAQALLRRAFADRLPPAIINRPSANDAQDAEAARWLEMRAETLISDREFAAERTRLKLDWHYHLPNKEALSYYKILREFYSDESILPWMGRSRSR